MRRNPDRLVRALSLALVFVCGATSGAQSCQLFDAALEAAGARPQNTVLVDQTVIGIPFFALSGAVTMRRGDQTLLGQTEATLRALNTERKPVHACLADTLKWRTISDSTLMTFFADPGKRWTAFTAAYPATPSFALISQPLITGDTAIIYIAVASGELSGGGSIVRFVRDSTGKWIKHSEVVLWVS